MSAGSILARFVFFLMVLGTALQMYWTALSLRDDQSVADARGRMNKLSALMLRNFPDRNLDNTELFWRSIQRDTPIRDPWGTEYLIDSRGSGAEKRFFWRSAGPDRVWRTGDDLEVEVPYGKPQAISPGEPLPVDLPTSNAQ